MQPAMDTYGLIWSCYSMKTNYSLLSYVLILFRHGLKNVPGKVIYIDHICFHRMSVLNKKFDLTQKMWLDVSFCRWFDPWCSAPDPLHIWYSGQKTYTTYTNNSKLDKSQKIQVSVFWVILKRILTFYPLYY